MLLKRIKSNCFKHNQKTKLID